MPVFTPSTSIYVQSYSTTQYLMDRSTNVIFTTECTLPCRQCTTNTSACTGCYSNGSLVSNKIILSNSTCISLCGNGKYLDTNTSTCENCHSICETCENFSICLSCPGNSYLYNSTCLTNCPFGFYKYGTICATCPIALFC